MYNTENQCLLCWGTCTFTVNTGAMVHQMVKSTITQTGLFNSFFAKMGETFGYGTSDQKAEDWWNQSEPVFGIDTTRAGERSRPSFFYKA